MLNLEPNARICAHGLDLILASINANYRCTLITTQKGMVKLANSHRGLLWVRKDLEAKSYVEVRKIFAQAVSALGLPRKNAPTAYGSEQVANLHAIVGGGGPDLSTCPPGYDDEEEVVAVPKLPRVADIIAAAKASKAA